MGAVAVPIHLDRDRFAEPLSGFPNQKYPGLCMSQTFGQLSKLMITQVVHKTNPSSIRVD
jgi:hypothetical protein